MAKELTSSQEEVLRETLKEIGESITDNKVWQPIHTALRIAKTSSDFEHACQVVLVTSWGCSQRAAEKKVPIPNRFEVAQCMLKEKLRQVNMPYRRTG